MFDLILYVPVNSFSVMSEWVFLVISTKQGLICLAQGLEAIALPLSLCAPLNGSYLTICLLVLSADITFANSLNPDQARQNAEHDLYPSFLAL